TGREKADIIWSNGNTNEKQAWRIDGLRVAGQTSLSTSDGRPDQQPGAIISVASTKKHTMIVFAAGDEHWQQLQAREMDGPRVLKRSDIVDVDGQSTRLNHLGYP